jgi:hypothetical protein
LLFYDNTDFTDILLGFSELFDILWYSLDSFIDLSEFGGNGVVFISCSGGNQFDFFFNHLLVFTNVKVSDIFDVDSED